MHKDITDWCNSSFIFRFLNVYFKPKYRMKRLKMECESIIWSMLLSILWYFNENTLIKIINNNTLMIDHHEVSYCVFSSRNNCFEFHAFDGAASWNDQQSNTNTAVFGSSLL